MASLDIEVLKAVFGKLKNIMDENREYLIELDSVMGDADLGLTMQKAFTAADNEAQGFGGTDPGKLLVKTGMAMAGAAPSTMGTLLATGFMKGSKSVSDTDSLPLGKLAIFFRAFTQGIIDAGKTAPGNKTIVDSLDPAATALEEAASGGKSLAEGMHDAYAASLQGVENTKNMKAQHGRAAYYREKSIGVQDPGATVGSLILYGFYLAVKEMG